MNVTSASWVNILEEPLADEEPECEMSPALDGVDVGLSFRCFEIRTLKVDLGT